MKLKNVLLTLGLALGVGAGVGAAVVSQSSETPIDAKADGVQTYYFVGNLSGFSWDASDDSNPIKNDGSEYYVLDASAVGNYKFKIITNLGDWNTCLGYDSLNDGNLKSYYFYKDSDGNVAIDVDDSSNAWKKAIYVIRINGSSINISFAWNYYGNDTSKTGAASGWASTASHYLIDGGPSATWSMQAGEEFKLTDRTDAYRDGYSATLTGTANGNAFSGGGSSNIVCSHAGDYSLTLSGGTLYVDYLDGTQFYYTGTDADKAGTAWTPYSAKPIVLNGSAVEFSFAKNEKFGLVSAGGAYLGKGYLNDNYFNCFGYDGNDVIVNMAYDHYTIALIIVDHALRIVPSAVSQTTKTNYVLDLNGNLLSSNPKAHCWHTVSETLSVGDVWPGMDMGTVAGADNLYEIEYWDKFDSLLFNNGTTDTINFTNVEDGKCLILGWGYDNDAGKWTSNCWVSLDAAKFIANYLKFAVDGAHEDAKGSGLCKTDGWYTAAKGAYEKLSESVQKDVCSSSLALARLQAWARVNEATFVVTDGVGAFSASRTVNMFAMNEVTNNGSLIAVVAITALATAAGMFFVFRRKEQ